jgi:2-haloalkanoic acid dehalogenase type II
MTETKAILFDAYGTVLDVGTYHHDITQHVVQQSKSLFGIATSVDEFKAYWNNEFELAFTDVIAYCGEFRNMRDLYGISTRNVFHRYGIRVQDAYIEELNYVYKEMLDEAVTVLPNVKRTLETLYTNGLRLGMISNGDTNELSAHLNGVSDLFDVIVTSEELEVYKPHPRIFNETLQKMGIAREKTAFVGDSLISDICGAKKAGLTTIWYNKRQRTLTRGLRPDFEISDMAEILEMLELKTR